MEKDSLQSQHEQQKSRSTMPDPRREMAAAVEDFSSQQIPGSKRQQKKRRHKRGPKSAPVAKLPVEIIRQPHDAAQEGVEEAGSGEQNWVLQPPAESPAEIFPEASARGGLEAEKETTGEQSRVLETSADGFDDSAVERLERIYKAFDEPQISGSEIEANRQEQADEVLAMQSIYGEDFRRIESEQIESPTFMMSVNVEISESLVLLADLFDEEMRREDQGSGDIGSSTSGSSERRTKHSFTVQNLPPIQMVFSMPPSYPSHSPPLFALQVLWLNSEKLSRYCSSLDEVWNEQQGQVVLYQWIDWLQNQSLSLVEVSGKLELGPYGVGGEKSTHKDFDRRAVSGCCSFNSDIARLLHYNEEKKSEKFCNSLHLCEICFTEKSGKDFVKLGCEHLFCWSCMQAHASILVKDGSVNKLNCPETNCRHSIPPFILKQLLDEEAFQRWETLVLQRSLDGMADVVYCPRCDEVCIEESDHFAQCGGCFFSFCGLCNQSWHVGQECVSPEARLQILQSRQQGQGKDEQKRREQEMINEMMNLQYVRKEAKQCPGCKMAISKTEGCNKMTCSNCGAYFCFRCGKAVKNYDHFGDGSCTLFEAAEVARWQPNEEMMDLQEQIEIQLQLWPERGRACPNCRQLNAKIGNNNHIYCWACRNSFCSLCNRVVRRTSEHYGAGPNKCRQHTAD